MGRFYNSIAFTIIGSVVSIAMTILYIQRDLQPDAGNKDIVITGIWAVFAIAWITATLIRMVRARHKA